MAEEQSGLGFERVVFFSDAVFAIVITLLVLEIQPPELETLSEAAIAEGLLGLVPNIIGFVTSFAIIGVMWVQHHQIFRYIKAYDGGLLLRNLVLLLCVSFVPFPTALFSDYYWSRIAFVLYAASFASVALAKLWVWSYVVRRPGLLAEGTDEQTVRRISRRSLSIPLACVVAVLVSFVSTWLAPIGFAFIPLFARLLDPTRKP